MDYPPKIFEILMLICFGSSWPFAVAKTIKTKIVVGKSPVFLVLIFIGYLSGISYKLTVDFDHVIWLYVLNGSMVLTEIVLYIKYEKQNLILQCQNFKNSLTTCTIKFMSERMPLKIN
jgi:hypothetical protein